MASNWLKTEYFFEVVLYWWCADYRQHQHEDGVIVKKAVEDSRDKQHSSTHHKSIQSSNYLLEFSKHDHFFYLLKLQIFWFKKLKRLFVSRQRLIQRTKLFFSACLYKLFRNRSKHRIRTKIEKDIMNAKNIFALDQRKNKDTKKKLHVLNSWRRTKKKNSIWVVRGL